MTASAPLVASQITAKPGSERRSAQIVFRATAWSSTTMMCARSLTAPTLPPVVVTEKYPLHGRAGKDTPHYESTLRYTSHGLVVVNLQRACVMGGVMFYMPG